MVKMAVGQEDRSNGLSLPADKLQYFFRLVARVNEDTILPIFLPYKIAICLICA
jgi:hypothetical protein